MPSDVPLKTLCVNFTSYSKKNRSYLNVFNLKSPAKQTKRNPHRRTACSMTLRKKIQRTLPRMSYLVTPPKNVQVMRSAI